MLMQETLIKVNESYTHTDTYTHPIKVGRDFLGRRVSTEEDERE